MISMYVSAHVNVPSPTLPYFIPLQLGSVDKEPWQGFVSDNTGDHISHKNQHFGELTGLYWVWKNTTQPLVGWCHYRRFFSPLLMPPQHYKGVTVDLSLAQNIISHDTSGSIFSSELSLCQMIVPTKITVKPKEFYCHVHRECDWDDMVKAIAILYPDELQEAQRYFSQENGSHFWCMFMTHRHILNQYCEWLFPLLFQLETMIIPPTDVVRSRVFAFLAEHLFPYWTTSRGLSVIQRPILMVNPAA